MAVTTTASRVESYDHQQGVKDLRVTNWEFKCAYCGSERLLIHPVGIAYRPHTIEQFDDLPQEIRGYYKNLPHVADAVIRCLEGERNTRILIECMDCKTTVNTFMNKRPDITPTERVVVDKVKMKKYLIKLYGVDSIRCCQN